MALAERRSLVSSTVFVTAGRCTESPTASAVVFFVSDMEPNPSIHGVPAPGGLYDRTAARGWISSFLGE